MKRYYVRYKDKIWSVETIYFSDDNNARIRIGTLDEEGYHWELVFEKEVVVLGEID